MKNGGSIRRKNKIGEFFEYISKNNLKNKKIMKKIILIAICSLICTQVFSHDFKMSEELKKELSQFSIENVFLLLEGDSVSTGGGVMNIKVINYFPLIFLLERKKTTYMIVEETLVCEERLEIIESDGSKYYVFWIALCITTCWFVLCLSDRKKEPLASIPSFVTLILLVLLLIFSSKVLTLLSIAIGIIVALLYRLIENIIKKLQIRKIKEGGGDIT